MTNTYLQKALAEKIGQKTKQSCPECGAVMVIRQNKHDHGFFLGCHNFPDCKHTTEIPESLKLELLGFKRLPGFNNLSINGGRHDPAKSQDRT